MGDAWFIVAYFICTFSSGYCNWFRPCQQRTVQAVCHLRPNPTLPSSSVHGIAVFTQTVSCYGVSPLRVYIKASGLKSDGRGNLNGIHIHRSGDLSEGCESMGPHYNPYSSVHGSPEDPLYRRHVGDLGNWYKDPRGKVHRIKFVSIASLVGPLSILGRGLIIHEKTDDLGRGGNSESLRMGNAGRRLACCMITAM